MVVSIGIRALRFACLLESLEPCYMGKQWADADGWRPPITIHQDEAGFCLAARGLQNQHLHRLLINNCRLGQNNETAGGSSNRERSIQEDSIHCTCSRSFKHLLISGQELESTQMTLKIDKSAETGTVFMM